jgi:hypothetical protein
MVLGTNGGKYLEELVFIKDFRVDTFNVIQWQLNNEK